VVGRRLGTAEIVTVQQGASLCEAMHRKRVREGCKHQAGLQVGVGGWN
jgi:hypothetical protein